MLNRSKFLGFLVFSGIAFSQRLTAPRQSAFFEQATDSSTYTAESRDLSVILKASEIRFTLAKQQSLTMHLEGITRLPAPQAFQPLPGNIHRLVGEQSQWRKNLQRFQGVEYRNVYPGINLVFQGKNDKLEYDFVVAPGADPSRIRVRWIGASSLRLTENNGLLVTTKSQGELKWGAPVLYQDVDGTRHVVSGGFRIDGKDRASFLVGEYDHARELVIDPTVTFSTYIGGSLYDIGRAVATDAANNVYVAGSTKSTDLAVSKTAFQAGYAGGTFNVASGDAFVAKYTSSGTLVYLTYLGGAKDDIATAIAVDAAGNAYVTGYTNSTDFPVTSGAYQKKFAGSGGNFYSALGDAFITKLSPDGSSTVYSTYLGGGADDIAFGIALDSAGNAYVTGTTLSNSFPITAGAFQTNSNGSGGQEIFPRFGAAALIAGDVFVTKLDSAGAKIIYSTFLGGHGDDCALTIAVDSAGEAYVAGYTLSSDFPVTAGAAQTTNRGREDQNEFFNFGDAFVAKFDANGANLIFSTYLGGAGDDQISAIALDAAGNVYATGSTTSMNFPITPGVFQKTYGGPTSLPFTVDQLFGDAFMTKLSPAGALLLSTYIGGAGDEVGYGIAVDGSGNILVAGNSSSPNFAVTSDAAQSRFAGPASSSNGNVQGDGFLAVFNPGASSETYSTFYGGTLDDAFLGMALSPTGTAYMVGATASTNFPLLRPAQAARGGPSAGGVSRADMVLTGISGFSPSSTAGTLPVITSIVSATGETATIAQNTWIEIKGVNLVPATTPAAGVIWSSAPEFQQGQMPTQLGGVSATVNGKSAFIYYFCSSKTNTACASDQVNVLTPFDSTTGTVQVQLTSVNGTASFAIQLQPVAPGFFQFGSGPYVAAVHLDGSLVAPTGLYPTLASSPVKPNELILVFANGFGQTTPAIVNGSSTPTGVLATKPLITIAGVPAVVQYAGIVSPGLYQFNIVVPAVADGDDFITATYNGATTQTGAKITVKQ